MHDELNWELVEDLLLVAQDGKCPELPAQALVAFELGPCVEYLRSTNDCIKPDFLMRNLNRACRIRNAIQEFASTGPYAAKDLGDSAKSLEIVAVPRVESGEPWPTAFGAFLRRMEMAARNVGIEPKHTAALVAAVEELICNILDHSRSVETGIVAYNAADRFVEFVVSDAGIGVLSSLSSGHQAQDLRTETGALKASIVEGRSRFGAGRGYGYRPLFRVLHRVAGDVRMHSGDGILEILESGNSRTRPGPQIGGLSITLKFWN